MLHSHPIQVSNIGHNQIDLILAGLELFLQTFSANPNGKFTALSITPIMCMFL